MTEMTDHDLSCAVAERVLGWPKCVECGNIHAPHDYTRLPTLDAFAVIEALTKKRDAKTRYKLEVKYIVDVFVAWFGGHPGESPTLPRAVALAALAAVDAERAE